jgi:hypothetical protein
MDPNSFRIVEIELELSVNAPIERVFKALTEEIDAWWPHRFKPDSTVHADIEVGGKVVEQFKDGGGALYAEFLYLDAPTKIVSGGASVLNRGYASYTADTLEAVSPSSCLIKRKFQVWGLVPPDAEEMYRGGVVSILHKAFADYMAHGIRYSPEATK